MMNLRRLGPALCMQLFFFFANIAMASSVLFDLNAMQQETWALTEMQVAPTACTFISALGKLLAARNFAPTYSVRKTKARACSYVTPLERPIVFWSSKIKIRSQASAWLLVLWKKLFNGLHFHLCGCCFFQKCQTKESRKMLAHCGGIVLLRHKVASLISSYGGCAKQTLRSVHRQRLSL